MYASCIKRYIHQQTSLNSDKNTQILFIHQSKRNMLMLNLIQVSVT